MSLHFQATRGGIREIRAFKNELIAKIVTRARRRVRISKLAQWANHEDAALRQLYRESSIVGLGFGEKITERAACGVTSIRVYVTRKRAQKDLSKNARIPPKINGIPTDVIAYGRPRLHQAAGVPWGVGISHERGGRGTLGCVVTLANAKGRFVLSAAHVLAPRNNNLTGESIVFPPRTSKKSSRLATLHEYQALTLDGSPNRFDAGIAKLIAGDGVADIVSTGPIDPRPLATFKNQGVVKQGAATGFTRGMVSDLAADMTLELDTGTLFYDDLLGISGHDGPFSQPGDSGALVVDAASGRPVGLLVGGRTTMTIVAPIQPILTRFQAEIVAAALG